MSTFSTIDLSAYAADAAYLIAVAICGLVVWKGDRPLKLVGAVLLIAWMLSALTGKRNVYGMDYPTTVIDTNCALVFIWISLRWRQLWCAVLAALMIIKVTIPLVVFFDRDIDRYNQTLSYNVVTVLLLAVMAVATWQTSRARKLQP